MKQKLSSCTWFLAVITCLNSPRPTPCFLNPSVYDQAQVSWYHPVFYSIPVTRTVRSKRCRRVLFLIHIPNHSHYVLPQLLIFYLPKLLLRSHSHPCVASWLSLRDSRLVLLLLKSPSCALQDTPNPLPLSSLFLVASTDISATVGKPEGIIYLHVWSAPHAINTLDVCGMKYMYSPLLGILLFFKTHVSCGKHEIWAGPVGSFSSLLPSFPDITLKSLFVVLLCLV